MHPGNLPEVSGAIFFSVDISRISFRGFPRSFTLGSFFGRSSSSHGSSFPLKRESTPSSPEKPSRKVNGTPLGGIGGKKKPEKSREELGGSLG